jgi:hypothetical protein
VIRACADSLKETAMGYVTYIVAIATLAGAVAGCADPYYPSSGNSQGYAYQSNYPANYGSSSYPVGSGYYPTRYGYGSTGDYRSYSGVRSGPQVTIRLP